MKRKTKVLHQQATILSIESKLHNSSHNCCHQLLLGIWKCKRPISGHLCIVKLLVDIVAVDVLLLKPHAHRIHLSLKPLQAQLM